MERCKEFGASDSAGGWVLLCKFGKKHHLDRLREDGVLHFESQEAFARVHRDPVRGDKFEGVDRLYQPRDMRSLTISAPGIAPITADPALFQGPLRAGLGGASRYTCSFFGWTDPSAVPTPDPQMDGFGGSALLITNTPEFIDRAARAAEAQGLALRFGPVEYFDESAYSGSVGPFRKSSRFGYQREFRLVATGAAPERFELMLGSLVDISTSVFVAADFRRVIEIGEPSSSR